VTEINELVERLRDIARHDRGMLAAEPCAQAASALTAAQARIEDVEKELEQKDRAYIIAHNQAMENGSRLRQVERERDYHIGLTKNLGLMMQKEIERCIAAEKERDEARRLRQALDAVWDVAKYPQHYVDPLSWVDRIARSALSNQPEGGE
jgi:hypothetical protein